MGFAKNNATIEQILIGVVIAGIFASIFMPITGWAQSLTPGSAFARSLSEHLGDNGVGVDGERLRSFHQRRLGHRSALHAIDQRDPRIARQ